MEINEKVAVYVAGLAKIEFDPDDIIRFTSEFKDIIGYIDKLNELDTEGIEAKSEVFDEYNIFREDIVLPSIPREKIIGNAASHDEEYVMVPNVVE